MYFWENNAERALQWANDKKSRKAIKTPAIIGAVLDLGYCCDFTDSRFISLIKDYYDDVRSTYKIAGKKLPENRDIRDDKFKDRILRELDCTVIEFMHSVIRNEIADAAQNNRKSELKEFDSVRGMFQEGGFAFKGSGIRAKTHTQICIRNHNCIKGFFIPREENEQWVVP